MVCNGLLSVEAPKMRPEFAERSAETGELTLRWPYDELVAPTFDFHFDVDAVESECFRDPDRLTVAVAEQAC